VRVVGCTSPGGKITGVKLVEILYVTPTNMAVRHSNSFADMRPLRAGARNISHQ
jgi:hypothetical protein